jgi:hypothetical protein
MEPNTLNISTSVNGQVVSPAMEDPNGVPYAIGQVVGNWFTDYHGRHSAGVIVDLHPEVGQVSVIMIATPVGGGEYKTPRNFILGRRYGAENRREVLTKEDNHPAFEAALLLYEDYKKQQEIGWQFWSVE